MIFWKFIIFHVGQGWCTQDRSLLCSYVHHWPAAGRTSGGYFPCCTESAGHQTTVHNIRGNCSDLMSNNRMHNFTSWGVIVPLYQEIISTIITAYYQNVRYYAVYGRTFARSMNILIKSSTLLWNVRWHNDRNYIYIWFCYQFLTPSLGSISGFMFPKNTFVFCAVIHWCWYPVWIVLH